jgi:hypothetical protein
MATTTRFDKKGRLRVTGMPITRVEQVTSGFAEDVASVTIRPGTEAHEVDLTVRFKDGRTGVERSIATVWFVSAVHGTKLDGLLNNATKLG